MSKMSFRRLSFRQVLFVLSGILVHYVGYYSFYRVYSFITSGIITSGIITSDIITSGIITSGIEPAVRLPRCFKTKKKRKNMADIIYSGTWRIAEDSFIALQTMENDAFAKCCLCWSGRRWEQTISMKWNSASIGL